MSNKEQASTYGYCPKCGAAGIAMERSPNGNTQCANGHRFPHAQFRAALAAQPVAQAPDVDRLANIIREVDGSNSLGAGALAEKIVEALSAAPSPEAGKPEQHRVVLDMGEGRAPVMATVHVVPAEASKPVHAEAPSEPMRAHVEQFATKAGWKKDEGEGAFEFVQRKCYHQGWQDGRREALGDVHRDTPEVATPPAPCGAVEREALALAANRLERLAINHPPGTSEHLEISGWVDEARAALATSPTASGVGEREAFEDWAQKNLYPRGKEVIRKNHLSFERDAQGELLYAEPGMHRAWRGWMARAALATQPLEQKPVAWWRISDDGSDFDVLIGRDKPTLPDNGHEWYALYGRPQPEQVAQDELTPDDVNLLEQVVNDFCDDGETMVDHSDLMRFVNMGYLECERFMVSPSAQKAIDAARASGKGGGE